MFNVTLPDGTILEYESMVTGHELALSIGPGLAKAALVISVNNVLKDMSFEIEQDSNIRFITSKDEEALEIIRHDAAHVMASAVKELYPDTKVTIGPTIENGFYYDFSRSEPFSSEDLVQIEEKMLEIVDRDEIVKRYEWSREKAIEYFSSIGETYKVEIINDIPESQILSIYQHGDFVDLCRGPHLSSTKSLGKVFKLTSVAGAYWRGDSNNEMLQRIYGTAWGSKKQLKQHLENLELAEKNDHRRLGRDLGIFMISDGVGKGLPMLLERGATIYRTLERFIVDEEIKRGYKHVNTPVLGRKSLYEISGHLGHYEETMYPSMEVGGDEYMLRPMTCPHHFMMYKNDSHSYRELPLKYAEISPLFRKEHSGGLVGMIRVLSFHLADAHIFLEPSQLKDEFRKVVELIIFVMDALGVSEYCWFRLSLRDKDKSKFIDDDESWNLSETNLREICEDMQLKYEVGIGEAAFYGPKLDVQMRTVGGREETLFTNQIDLSMSHRFDLTYVSDDGSEKRPWIIHRSSLGCLERTIAFLLEFYGGAFPTWLAPVQVMVLSLTEHISDYAQTVTDQLRDRSIRAELDTRNETLNRKVRESMFQKFPYIAVVGEKEKETNTVTVTNRATQEKETMDVQEFVNRIDREIKNRDLSFLAAGSAPSD